MLVSLTDVNKFYSDQSGNELVEFAFSALLLFTVIFGIMDFSRALYVDHYVAYAASEATRYAMVRGSTWQGTSCSATVIFNCDATSTDVSNFVLGITPLGIASTNLSIQTTWSGMTATGAPCATTNGINSPGCQVKVVVSDSFNFVVPVLPTNTLVLTSTSAVAISK